MSTMRSPSTAQLDAIILTSRPPIINLASNTVPSSAIVVFMGSPSTVMAQGAIIPPAPMGSTKGFQEVLLSLAPIPFTQTTSELRRCEEAILTGMNPRPLRKKKTSKVAAPVEKMHTAAPACEQTDLDPFVWAFTFTADVLAITMPVQPRRSAHTA